MYFEREYNTENLWFTFVTLNDGMNFKKDIILYSGNFEIYIFKSLINIQKK